MLCYTQTPQSSQPRRYSERPQHVSTQAIPYLPHNPDLAPSHYLQIYSTFLGLYFPEQRLSAAPMRSKWLLLLPTVHTTSTALRRSMESFTLAFIGSTFGDAQCSARAAVKYSESLRHIAGEVSRPDVPRAEVLTAILLAQMVELIQNTAPDKFGRNGWMRHAIGAQTYFSQSPEQIFDSPLGKSVFHNMQHTAFCIGLTTRKRSLLESIGYQQHLQGIAQAIPGILEGTDRVKNATLRGDETEKSLLLEHIRHYKSLLETYNVEVPQSHSRGSHITGSTTFFSKSEFQLDKCGIPGSFLDFPSARAHLEAQLLWVCRMALNSSILDLLKEEAMQETIACEQDFYRTAVLYCRSIPYGCQGDRSLSRQGPFYVQEVVAFFEHYGYEYEMIWARKYVLSLEAL